MGTNQKLLLEKFKKWKGMVAFIKPVEDLPLRKDFDGNSYFVIGDFGE